MFGEALELAKRVIYDVAARKITVTLNDGSRNAWPVRLLKMVKRSPEGRAPLGNVPDQHNNDLSRRTSYPETEDFTF